MNRMIKIVLSWLLVICIPVTALGISGNILFRLPDTYQYVLNSTGLLSKFNSTGQEEAVAQSIAKYLQYRQAEFQYQYDEEEEMSLLFSKDEQETMERLRTIFNIVGVVSLLSFGILVAAYIVLIKGEHIEIIRMRFKASYIVYAIMIVTVSIFFLVPSLKVKLWLALLMQLNETDLMYMIYAGSFFKLFGVMNIVISLVAMLILMYFTWKYTKPKNIFW